MPEAVRDGVEHDEEYMSQALVQEHDEPPKFEASIVDATHAAVVCSEHDDWPAPVVVEPAVQARQLADDVYVTPPSE